MDTDTLTADTLAEILKEPNIPLLRQVLRILGADRCAVILAEALTIEQSGGMLTKVGDRRRTPGGTFLQLVRERCTVRERRQLFPWQPVPAKRPRQTTAQSPPGALASPGAPVAPATLAMPPATPVILTLDLWKGLKPMAATATLKLVLRDLPETRERDGMVYMTLTNEPRGLPKGITLDSGPLYLTCAGKQWRTACTKAAQIRTTGTPALLIVEAHVSTRDGALVAVVKGIQVVEGTAPVDPQATARQSPPPS